MAALWIFYGATAPFFAVFVGVAIWESERYLAIGPMGRLSFGDGLWVVFRDTKNVFLEYVGRF